MRASRLTHIIVADRIHSKWDSHPTTEDGLALSSELLSSLATFQALVTSLASSLPLAPLQSLYRNTAMHITNEYLIPRLVLAHVFSAAGGLQLHFDLAQGWEAAGRQAGVRAPAAGWAKLKEAATLLSLPASAEGKEGELVIGKVSQVAWDTDEKRYKEVVGGSLGVKAMGRKEVQAVLKKRPEVWR